MLDAIAIGEGHDVEVVPSLVSTDDEVALDSQRLVRGRHTDVLAVGKPDVSDLEGTLANELADTGLDPVELSEDDLSWSDAVGDPTVGCLDRLEDRVELLSEIGDDMVVIERLPVVGPQRRHRPADEHSVRNYVLELGGRFEHTLQHEAVEARCHGLVLEPQVAGFWPVRGSELTASRGALRLPVRRVMIVSHLITPSQPPTRFSDACTGRDVAVERQRGGCPSHEAFSNTMNSTILLGNLTADPKLHVADNGKKRATFPMAANEGQGETEKTHFVNLTAFDSLAENTVESFSKGMRVIVSARLNTFKQTAVISGEEKQLTMVAYVATNAGPEIRFALAEVTKVVRDGMAREGNGNGASSAAPSVDAAGEASTNGSAAPAAKPAAALVAYEPIADEVHRRETRGAQERDKRSRSRRRHRPASTSTSPSPEERPRRMGRCQCRRQRRSRSTAPRRREPGGAGDRDERRGHGEHDLHR
ncbi:MAG: single-stranded DNA-binding protein [Acidimicrobiales bacterium]